MIVADLAASLSMRLLKRTILPLKPVIATTPAVPSSAPAAAAAAPARAVASAGATPPAAPTSPVGKSVATPPVAPVPAMATPTSRWAGATLWLMGAFIALSIGLAGFAVDCLLQPQGPSGHDDLDPVRQQLLIALSVAIALVLVAAIVAMRWVRVARREEGLRQRADQLAGAAESERARAETVARDKARFLGMLGHELLTPLQSIWSTMDVIESRGRVESSDPAFTRLKHSTRSLRGRISDLVDFAKMSSGRLETRIRGFQLDKLIDTALRDVEEALANRNLDVHWDAGPELSQRVFSDPARLRQVIDNLLTNAIKYTERGGITIQAELRRDQGVLSVEISDTGVGVHPDEMARLFEPFYRSPQTAGMAEGSGLGLAVVRSLVDLMGGTIRVDSRLGQGTSVTVEVPITEGVDGAPEPPARIDTQRPVLVVDDSLDARRAIADVIRALGVEVVEAVDGPTGLITAEQRDFQAIFLDMQMPGLSGFEVACRLRGTGGRHQRTFLVLISACSDLDDVTVNSVFDARIDKPVGRNDLVAALGRASEGLSERRPSA